MPGLPLVTRVNYYKPLGAVSSTPSQCLYEPAKMFLIPNSTPSAIPPPHIFLLHSHRLLVLPTATPQLSTHAPQTRTRYKTSRTMTVAPTPQPRSCPREREDLADGNGPTQKQIVETILRYVPRSLRNLWMTLPGYCAADWCYFRSCPARGAFT